MGLDARKPVFGVCEQQRRIPACAYAQTDQRLCYSLFGSIISKLASGENLIFLLVSVAEEIDLSLTLSKTPKIGFVASLPILSLG